MIDSGLLPPGAIQLIVGGVGDLFDHLTGQDVVSFTGSASTALKLRSHPVVQRESVRFVAEQDSLNASLLGPDAAPGTPEFDLFVKEVVTEMTVKAGQKCTAIRRAMAPAEHLDAVEAAIRERLAATKVGDPRDKDSRMGALVRPRQRDDVRGQIAKLIAAGARIVAGDPDASPGVAGGAFMEPILLRTDDPWAPARSTMSRRSARSRPSCPTATSPTPSRSPIAAWAAWRCRCSPIRPTPRATSSRAPPPFTAGCWSSTATMPPNSTGHGSPLPVLVHGGPGRAGGSEEMGGVRGVKHYMQRTAIQSSPAMIAAISRAYIPGGPKHDVAVHPFRKRMSELAIGDTLKTASRTVTIADIEHFAEFTGDKFYAHMDEEAAKASPIFEGRVAHGYLILSFAAGLFVDPDPGPVLANTGLENLRFLTPLYPGDAMRVELTVRSKIAEERGHRRGPLGGRNLQPEGRTGRHLRPADREHALRQERRAPPFVQAANHEGEQTMKISEVMTQRRRRRSAPDQTAQEAASFMLSADAGSIPVLDGDKVIGMITDRDIAVRGVAEGHGPDTPVRDLMTDGIICARDDDDVEEVAQPDERGAGPPPAGASTPRNGWSASSASATSARETDGEAAHEALEGVSQPGGQHQQ